MLYCYVKDDRRIHVDRDDDGSLMRATLLTNPKRGFRRFLNEFKTEAELSEALDGFEMTWMKEL